MVEHLKPEGHRPEGSVMVYKSSTHSGMQKAALLVLQLQNITIVDVLINIII